MKKWIAAAACLAALAGGPGHLGAQARTVDGASFTPPAGWDLGGTPNQLMITRIDKAQGTFCQIVVYQSQPSKGNPSEDFSSEWNEVVARNFTPASEPQVRTGRTPGGYTLLEGASPVEKDGQQYFVHLMVFQVGGRVQSTLVLSSNAEVFKSYGPQVDAFRASFRSTYAQAAPAVSTLPPASAAPAASTAPAPRDPGTISGKGITGVWMGFTTVIGKFTPEVRWMTFYDDGQVLLDIPREGLDGFDRAASRQNEHEVPYWSRFTWDGRKGAITTPGVTSPRVLKAVDKGRITAGADTYSRCPPVDGLRLAGSWTTYSPDDPDLDRLAGKERPLITLTKDGRFVDEGIFATFLHTTYGADQSVDAPGAGTYTVKAYTLTLSYSDGRTHRVALTGFLDADPVQRSDIIYLERGRFNRRR
jgi:hypothetical protein